MPEMTGETRLVIFLFGPREARCPALIEACGVQHRLMSYPGPRGEKHYSLYPFSSLHPTIYVKPGERKEEQREDVAEKR